jgi:hypothetical protein
MVQKKKAKETEDTLVWRTGLSGAPGPYDSKLFTFGFLRLRFAIIHRTVRCATGMLDLDHERLPLHSDEKVTNSKFIFMLLLPFYSQLKILVRQ